MGNGTTLSSSLWSSLNKLRGSVEVTEYKNYILPFLYYCYISRKIQKVMSEELENDELTYQEAWSAKEDGQLVYRDELTELQMERFGVVIPPKYLASHIADECHENIPDFGYQYFVDLFNDAIDYFEDNCNDSFRGTMRVLDLTSDRLSDDPEEAGKLAATMFVQSYNIVNSLNMDNGQEVLGDVYEQLMGYFASSAGKKGGEFFTPKEMSRLVAKLATHNMQHVKAISDPTCGSGSLLIQAAKEITSKGYSVGRLYGQEKVSITSKLAKINMAIHEISAEDFEVNCCDTLGTDIYPDEMYDVTVANPPYSVEWNNSESRYGDDRFAGYGALAPAKTADLAFVQHIVHHMADHGRAAILLPHGILFRGNSEGTIRKYLINTLNVVDAVIGLPVNCFYGTNIAVCCLVLRRDRNGDSKNICFIDASKYFTAEKAKNRITDEDINRIMDAYSNREDIPHFCSVVDIDKIAENDFNLNIPLYVEAEKDTVEHDLGELFKEFSRLSQEEDKLKASINQQLESFGVQYRFEVSSAGEVEDGGQENE